MVIGSMATMRRIDVARQVPLSQGYNAAIGRASPQAGHHCRGPRAAAGVIHLP
jgi:hypothetical protein